jgi:Protein of unknown function (DUF2563)
MFVEAQLLQSGASAVSEAGGQAAAPAFTEMDNRNAATLRAVRCSSTT